MSQQLRLPVELVIFDLGDTLIYEQGPWDELFPEADRQLWAVLHRAGVSIGPDVAYGDSPTLFDVYYKLHRNDLNEPTIAAVLEGILHVHGAAIDTQVIREALRAMFSVTQRNWLPDEQAVPTLETLKRRGSHIGLISNASDDENTQALIDKASIRPYLEFIRSSAAQGRRKPDPSIFRAALAHFGTAPGRAVMVGDNYEADILGAYGAGMQGIWLTRHVTPAAQLPRHPDVGAVAGSLAEIPHALGFD